MREGKIPLVRALACVWSDSKQPLEMRLQAIYEELRRTWSSGGRG